MVRTEGRLCGARCIHLLPPFQSKGRVDGVWLSNFAGGRLGSAALRVQKGFITDYRLSRRLLSESGCFSVATDTGNPLMLKPMTIEKSVEPELSTTFGWVVAGAFLGSLVVGLHIALDVFEVLTGYRLPLHPASFHEIHSPLAHVLAEFALFGGGGGVVFGLIGVILNRPKHR